MGCGRSSDFEVISRKDEFMRWNVHFAAMQLTKHDVKKLYEVFCSMDTDGRGSIDVVELLSRIDVNRNKFTERVFSMFDEDKSGQVNFREFVLSLWSYCTLTKDALAMFAFDLYDAGTKGVLTTDEVFLMLQELYGKSEAASMTKVIQNDLIGMELGNIPLNVDNFKRFLKTHQALLFPVFQMQTAIRRNILGVRFWEFNANKRLKFSNGKHISVGNFISFNMNGKQCLDIGRTNNPQDFGGSSEVNEIMEFVGSRQARQNAQKHSSTDIYAVSASQSPSRLAHDLQAQKFCTLLPHRVPSSPATCSAHPPLDTPQGGDNSAEIGEGSTKIGEHEDQLTSLRQSVKPAGERALQQAGGKRRQRRHTLVGQLVPRVATPAYANISNVEAFDPRQFLENTKAQSKVHPLDAAPDLPLQSASSAVEQRNDRRSTGSGSATSSNKSAVKAHRASGGNGGNGGEPQPGRLNYSSGKIEHDFMGRRRRQSFA